MSSFTATASTQAKKISAMNSAISNTILCNPVTRLQPDSCSTPSHKAIWTKVVVRGRKKIGHLAASPPPLAILQSEAPIHPAELPVDTASDLHSAAGPMRGKAAPTATCAFPALFTTGYNGNSTPGSSTAAVAALHPATAPVVTLTGSSFTSRPRNS